jgi:excisionase family DNA binding protein
MSAKDKGYYSSREAAELLGVAVSTIQLWTNNGILSAWTTGGGHRRITCSSVDKLLEQQSALYSSDIDKRLSIVIVEDDVKQLDLYQKQIKIMALGADITTASNGYEGLIKIGSVIPDVIITDLLMPNIDGLQMIHELKKIPELKHSSIIIATGLTADEIKKKGRLPAGIEVLTKPVLIEDLRDKLFNLQQLTKVSKKSS